MARFGIRSTRTLTQHRAHLNGAPVQGVVRSDALSYLRSLPDDCVDLCVTSPPYWAKRTYGAGSEELGQERVPEEYLDRLLAIFAEARRVLRPSGWAAVNLGDTMSNQPGRGRGSAKRAISAAAQKASAIAPDQRQLDMPVKSATLIPWRFAYRMGREQRWVVRPHVTWHKLGHQPEHVNDRLTLASEPLLLFTPTGRSFYRHPRQDGASANETDVWSITVGRGTRGKGHPAVFPEALVERSIQRFCPAWGVVIDPFAGSGTVGDVATRLGRTFLGCDLVNWAAEDA